MTTEIPRFLHAPGNGKRRAAVLVDRMVTDPPRRAKRERNVKTLANAGNTSAWVS